MVSESCAFPLIWSSQASRSLTSKRRSPFGKRTGETGHSISKRFNGRPQCVAASCLFSIRFGVNFRLTVVLDILFSDAAFYLSAFRSSLDDLGPESFHVRGTGLKSHPFIFSTDSCCVAARRDFSSISMAPHAFLSRCCLMRKCAEIREKKPLVATNMTRMLRNRWNPIVCGLDTG